MDKQYNAKINKMVNIRISLDFNNFKFFLIMLLQLRFNKLTESKILFSKEEYTFSIMKSWEASIFQ